MAQVRVHAMIWITGLGGALARGTVVAAAAVCAGGLVSGLLARATGKPRRAAWALVLTPMLTPTILVGYAYSVWALSLGRGANELLYSALLLMKLVPVTALVLHLTPATLSAQAVHCRSLVGGGRFSAARIAFVLRAEGARWLGAFTVTFLLAFVEFEMASLVLRSPEASSWVVSLFDAHAGKGLALADTLRLAAVPALIEGAMLAAAIGLLLRRRGALELGRPNRPAGGTVRRVVAWAYLALAALAVTVVPCATVLGGTVRGLGALLDSFVLGWDILASVMFALAAGSCACAAALALVRRPRRAVAFALPGLFGALPLALVLLAAFQLPGLRTLGETPLALVLALALLLLPYALVCVALLRLRRPAEALHAARMLREGAQRRALTWRLSGRLHFLVAFLLFCWAYFDVTASAILAPVDMTTAFVRLYNLMHYGQMQVLSAMVCVTTLVPVALAVTLAGARPMLGRLVRHG